MGAAHFADLAVVHDLGLADDGPPLVLVGGQQRAKVVPAIPLEGGGRSAGRLLEQCPDDLLAVVNPDAEVAVKGHRDRADHLRQFQGGCVVDRQHSDGEAAQNLRREQRHQKLAHKSLPCHKCRGPGSELKVHGCHAGGVVVRGQAR